MTAKIETHVVLARLQAWERSSPFVDVIDPKPFRAHFTFDMLLR